MELARASDEMVSVIIPTYNEEKTIRTLLDTLSDRNNPEIIVADGGSSDRTVEFAQSYPVKLIQCTQAGTGRKNRAGQMNEAARISRGDILFFLHGDCFPEEGTLEAIERCLEDGYSGGCLSQKIMSRNYIYPVRNTIYAKMFSKISNGVYRGIETSGNIRAKLFKIFYGDQAIFVRRDVFFQIGGFDQVELFDDLIFSRKLTQKGKTCVLNKKVYTSPRRWQKQGIIKTTLINWIITIGFLFGVSPRALKKMYFDIR